MIKQNLLSTKKMKSGLNVMGLFVSIILLLLIKKAGKNLFNFTPPSLIDENTYTTNSTNDHFDNLNPTDKQDLINFINQKLQRSILQEKNLII